LEPHICVVANRTADTRGEFVEVANSAQVAVALTGLELTDYTATQAHVHVYRFPAAVGAAVLTLPGGCSAYVFTGSGQNKRLDDGDLLLFMGREAPIWNDDGDVAYLRRLDGTFVDSLTVGSPKRHPGGH
jgi:hypothetical protein